MGNNMFGGSGSNIKDPHAFVAEQLALGRLVVFSKSYCPSTISASRSTRQQTHAALRRYCTSTKKALENAKIDFVLHELDQLGEPRNGPVQQALKEKSGITSTPQVFFGAKFIGDDGKIQALAKAGTLVEAVQG